METVSIDFGTKYDVRIVDNNAYVFCKETHGVDVHHISTAARDTLASGGTVHVGTCHGLFYVRWEGGNYRLTVSNAWNCHGIPNGADTLLAETEAVSAFRAVWNAVETACCGRYYGPGAVDYREHMAKYGP